MYVTIRPAPDWWESALCEWQPFGSGKWYKVHLANIFPEDARMVVYKAFKNGIEKVIYKYFKYDRKLGWLYVSMEPFEDEG